MFGIAVSGALRELRGSLAHLPGERADGAADDADVAGAPPTSWPGAGSAAATA